MKKAVGIIGVGLMGQGIAKNVIRRGYPLSLMDHPGNQPIDELVASGARVCASPGEVAREAEAIVLCVTGAPQVEAVLTGPGGVVDALRPGAVVIDCSTSLPDTSIRMAAALQAVGGHFLDAAMTRLPQHAQAGTLNLLCGGEPQVLESVRPILEAFSESIVHVGPVGAGHRMKLLHNYVSLGCMALLAEVAAHAHQAGIDPAILVDVLASGGGGGAALQRMTPFLIEGDASNVPFFLGNAAKDLGYYCEMAAHAGVYREIAQAVNRTLQRSVAGGHGRAYIPELAALLRKTGEARDS
ncbi:MAG: NAD(P)-dependent oxidoreductase [Burkholderiales bacterium]|nr:NAD(P)-dependent oxidoreductase [Burkholderiales bacterium]